METLKLVFTQFNDESLTISGLFLLITFFLIIIFWIYNRKKFHELSHQIPASVVKNYLDSIIQNSNALKSSLFRGGGLELAEGVPSVVSLGGLRGGESVSGSGVSSEEYSMKVAEIASLRSQLGEKTRLVSDLERRLKEMQDKGGDTGALTAKIQELEEALAKAGSGGADPNAQKRLDEVRKERDRLKEKLQEYEIIEDDIANLKRLQQENEQLKKALGDVSKGGAAPVAPAAAPTPPPKAAAPAPTPPPAAAAAPAAPEPAKAGPPVDPLNVPLEGADKSAEDLLSEFEKMLG